MKKILVAFILVTFIFTSNVNALAYSSKLSIIDTLYSPKWLFIYHLLLSIFVIIYYGMNIFEGLYERRNNKKYESNVRLNNVLGYFYLIVETLFLFININSINYIYIAIHIITSIVVLISMIFFKNKQD